MSRAAHGVKTSINVVPVAGPYAFYQRRLVTQESRPVQRRILPLSEQDMPMLLRAIARVPEPRDSGGRIHPLPGLLAIAIAAVVSGSSRVVETVKWAADLQPATRSPLPGGCLTTAPCTGDLPVSTPAPSMLRCAAGRSAGRF
ncbi:transposase family protein [Micromonospora zamorensis]|uniref:transposase family protein n=1 Tax=Micromonospora zamorensis TaxID=709883 RepID=UPI003898D6E3